MNKSTLKTFVEPERALASWGGQDNYEFVFVPEDRNGKGEKKVRGLHFVLSCVHKNLFLTFY